MRLMLLSRGPVMKEVRLSVVDSIVMICASIVCTYELMVANSAATKLLKVSTCDSRLSMIDSIVHIFDRIDMSTIRSFSTLLPMRVTVGGTVQADSISAEEIRAIMIISTIFFLFI
jgi:hypothetical protein